MAVLRKITATTEDVELPPAGNAATLWGSEAYAYHKVWITQSPEKYQPGTRAQLQRTANANGGEYAQARRDLDKVRREIRKVFAKVDLLIAPTMKTPPALLSAPGGGGGGGTTMSPSTCTACQASRFPADSRVQVYRSAFRSAELTSRRRTFLRWPTPTSRQRSGTREIRSYRRMHEGGPCHHPSWPGGVAAPVRRKCEASDAAQTGWWFRFKNISV